MRRKSSDEIDVGNVGGIAILVLTAGLIGAAIAMDDEEAVEEVTAVCVIASPAADGTYQIVEDGNCASHGDTYHSSHGAYHFYYGGTTSNGYIQGGTTTRPANAQIVTRSGKVIQRGGFGGRGSSGS